MSEPILRKPWKLPKYPMMMPIAREPFPGCLVGHDHKDAINYFKKYYPKLAIFYESNIRWEEFRKTKGLARWDEYVAMAGWHSEELKPEFMLKDAQRHYVDAIRVWEIVARKVMDTALLKRLSLWYRWEQSEIRRKEGELWVVAPGQKTPWWRQGDPPPESLMDPETPLRRSDRAKVAASKACGWHKMLLSHYQRVLQRRLMSGPAWE